MPDLNPSKAQAIYVSTPTTDTVFSFTELLAYHNQDGWWEGVKQWQLAFTRFLPREATRSAVLPWQVVRL